MTTSWEVRSTNLSSLPRPLPSSPPPSIVNVIVDELLAGWRLHERIPENNNLTLSLSLRVSSGSFNSSASQKGGDLEATHRNGGRRLIFARWDHVFLETDLVWNL
jgi:hypothetical protein